LRLLSLVADQSLVRRIARAEACLPMISRCYALARAVPAQNSEIIAPASLLVNQVDNLQAIRAEIFLCSAQKISRLLLSSRANNGTDCAKIGASGRTKTTLRGGWSLFMARAGEQLYGATHRARIGLHLAEGDSTCCGCGVAVVGRVLRGVAYYLRDLRSDSVIAPPERPITVA